jgi:hypothetical protein
MEWVHLVQPMGHCLALVNIVLDVWILQMAGKILLTPVDDKTEIHFEKVQCYMNLVLCYGRFQYTQLGCIIKSYVQPMHKRWVVREKYFSKCA